MLFAPSGGGTAKQFLIISEVTIVLHIAAVDLLYPSYRIHCSKSASFRSGYYFTGRMYKAVKNVRNISNSFVIDECKTRKRHKKALKKASKNPKNSKKKAEKVKYIKSKSKHRAAKLLTAVVLVMALVTFAVGMLTVDYNSCTTGWNEVKTEFAFAASQDQLNLTVMGRKYNVDISYLPEVENVAGRVSGGLYMLKPPSQRLMDMLFLFIKSDLTNYLKNIS